ncbi:TetR/AcrR family transcriptional regulator [Aurantimonas sp. MSK8Z-1]|uniref:TetR/AcrR family transcriptional regulator n=1 Tax=Mangrovibrevibacter kandeliae TaxID=2968473 RepID=UPI002119AFBD|nr:TetR/AcrR family transcriptional regulator [Aurantimonas sp. MSK8Z-1]MCW4115068.1 TetR/AcrR family transcriptional regulator [Aurantimonas sp. MSK8Z-1]
MVPALAEAFREHGFEAASLSVLSAATGLGKGSLYNFFPGGKAEMMAAVLDDVDRWFADAVFAPLEQVAEPGAAVAAMLADVDAYFLSGRRVCLVGWIGLGSSRDVFADRVRGYFMRWIEALAHCLQAGDVPEEEARRLAEDVVSGIQGAIILSRALGDEAAFGRILDGHRRRLDDALARRD